MIRRGRLLETILRLTPFFFNVSLFRCCGRSPASFCWPLSSVWLSWDWLLVCLLMTAIRLIHKTLSFNVSFFCVIILLIIKCFFYCSRFIVIFAWIILSAIVHWFCFEFFMRCTEHRNNYYCELSLWIIGMFVSINPVRDGLPTGDFNMKIKCHTFQLQVLYSSLVPDLWVLSLLTPCLESQWMTRSWHDSLDASMFLLTRHMKLKQKLESTRWIQSIVCLLGQYAEVHD